MKLRGCIPFFFLRNRFSRIRTFVLCVMYKVCVVYRVNTNNSPRKILFSNCKTSKQRKS